ncbi:hypothetical protein V2J09_006230 [Rumex salicifolius]
MASIDVVDQQKMHPTKFLNTLDFPVMLLRNVNPTHGLCNGTHLIITHLGDWVIEVEIIT